MTLVLGASGQVGTAFRTRLPDSMTPSRTELDLTDLGQIAVKVRALRPKLIINCAAYTAVDAAEADPEKAMIVNGEAVGVLATIADQLGVPFVTFSSDYVFDGETDQPYTETSCPNPINEYGRSKLRGEEEALRFPGSLVIRTSWLFSATHPNFVATILAKATAGDVRVVDDQWGTPTPVSVLAAEVLAAVERRTTGLLHIACPPPTTWYELSRDVCSLAGIDSNRVRPWGAAEATRTARRPRFSALSTVRSGPMPSWHAGLSEVVAALRASAAQGTGQSAAYPV